MRLGTELRGSALVAAVIGAALVQACSSESTGGTSSCTPAATSIARPLAPAGGCKGAQKQCSIYSGKLRCEGQRGCSWSATGEYCSGSARDCEIIDSASSCRAQDGCSWTEGAAGTDVTTPATPCASADASAPGTDPNTDAGPVPSACAGPPPFICVRCADPVETNYPARCLDGAWGCASTDVPQGSCPP